MEENFYSYNEIKENLNILKKELIDEKNNEIRSKIEIKESVKKIRSQKLPYPIRKLDEEISILDQKIRSYYTAMNAVRISSCHISSHEKFLCLFDMYPHYKNTIEFLYNFLKSNFAINDAIFDDSKEQKQEKVNFFFDLLLFIYHRSELINELPAEFLDIISVNMEDLVEMAIKWFKPSVLFSLIYITKINKKLSTDIKSHVDHVFYAWHSEYRFSRKFGAPEDLSYYMDHFNIHVCPKHPIHSYYDEILDSNKEDEFLSKKTDSNKEETSKKIKDFVNEVNLLSGTPFRNIDPEAISPHVLFKLFIKKSLENIETNSIEFVSIVKYNSDKKNRYLFYVQEIKDKCNKSANLFLQGCKEGSGLLLMDTFVKSKLWDQTIVHNKTDEYIEIAKKYVLDVEISYEEFLNSLKGV